MENGVSIGLALGGGGAKGLAHLPVLEVFDELGIKPKAISGASIGAILGALYSSGIKASDIRSYVDSHLHFKLEPSSLKQGGKNLMQIVKLLDLDFSGTGIIKGDSFSHFLYEILETVNFEDLEIPLTVVATDFLDSSQVVFKEGPILPAVKGSMSVPGVFKPSIYNERILVDGACVNPVPWDLLESCDVVIGVNVLGLPNPAAGHRSPKAAKVVLDSFEVMQRRILGLMMESHPPDLLLSPPLFGVGIFDFHKARSIYQQSQPIVDELRSFLKGLL